MDFFSNNFKLICMHIAGLWKTCSINIPYVVAPQEVYVTSICSPYTLLDTVIVIVAFVVFFYFLYGAISLFFVVHRAICFFSFSLSPV